MRATFIFACLAALTACNGGASLLSDSEDGGSAASVPVNDAPTNDPNASPADPNDGASPVVDPNTNGDPNGSSAIMCPGLGAWDAGSAAFEAEVLTLVNQARAKGADCHSAGVFAAQKPLAQDANLVCLARSYSKEMSDKNFFSHTDPNGASPFDRMNTAGIKWSSAGENIAEGYATPQDVVTGWLNSDGHCANIMGNYTLTGVGFYNALWTQDFITP